MPFYDHSTYSVAQVLPGEEREESIVPKYLYDRAFHAHFKGHMFPDAIQPEPLPLYLFLVVSMIITQRAVSRSVLKVGFEPSIYDSKIEVRSRKLILYLGSDLKLIEKLNRPLITLRNLDDPTRPPRQITPTGRKKKVLSLKPSTHYRLTVSEKDPSKRKGEISREYRFRSPSDRPSKLQKVEMHKISPNEVILNWLPPVQTNGRIQGYMVMYTFDNLFWAIKNTLDLQFNIVFEETVKKITALVAAYTGPNEGDSQGGGMGKISQITLALNGAGS
ncbi:unnamed protein product [Rodentolepis nana]|uniref:Fibronectin type-III domain-containing protein n=1 Tax=Rodentolepis nana TaxID=102285 RepID=A0A0R3TAF8_RODNA|nr:unnamed protein product [Rodentolepis nana]